MRILIYIISTLLFGLWSFVGFSAGGSINMALLAIAAIATMASCLLLRRWNFIATLLGGSAGAIAYATFELAAEDPTVIFLGPFVIITAFIFSISISVLKRESDKTT